MHDSGTHVIASSPKLPGATTAPTPTTVGLYLGTGCKADSRWVGRCSWVPDADANDLAKYFAILPAMFAALYPSLSALNVMRLATPQSANLSAVVFNALTGADGPRI